MYKQSVKRKIDSARWEQAIEDAEDTIAKCERKIESMKAAIETFEEAIKDGAAWPGKPSPRATTST